MNTKPYSISIVYQEVQGHSTKTMLRTTHVNAVSEAEAIGIGLTKIPENDRHVKNALVVTFAALEFKIIEEDDTDDKQTDPEVEKPGEQCE